ncbi:MAG: monovalent cation/H(+) antiporter subunit G [Alphaproteobacteria bacterium]|jgi:multicomponent Na+:H+ antiporter subunit G|nr:monovalent cation/H(+) antiporter subunit G [Alphaproteobacteria bacterium]
MELLVNGLSWALLMGGCFFIITGGVGLLRLPDIYTRMHASGVTDTLGAGMFLCGLMVQGGLSMVTVKLLLILVFILFTSPTATYALANALHGGDIKPVGRDGRLSETIDKRGESSKP